MNLFTQMTIESTISGEMWDLTDCAQINTERILEYVYTSTLEPYEYDNGVFYSDTEKMAETILTLVFRVTIENDRMFKSFLNAKKHRYILKVKINEYDYAIYFKVGNQVAQIDYSSYKTYNVELLTTNRPFMVTNYKLKTQDPIIYPGEENEYNTGVYEKAVYSTVGKKTGDVTFSISNRAIQTVPYFIITGKTTGNNITITVNNQKTVIFIDKPNSDFYYCNIPGYIDIKLDGERRIDVIDSTLASNFIFNWDQQINTVVVSGLIDTSVDLMNGVKTI